MWNIKKQFWCGGEINQNRSAIKYELIHLTVSGGHGGIVEDTKNLDKKIEILRQRKHWQRNSRVQNGLCIKTDKKVRTDFSGQKLKFFQNFMKSVKILVIIKKSQVV